VATPKVTTDSPEVWNVSVEYASTTAPTFSGAVNTSANFKINTNFTANITISNYALDYYIFSTNASGTWSNVSNASISGASYIANTSRNITVTQGKQVCWYYWANDSAGNSNVSTTYCFTVNNTAPTHSAPILNATTSNNYTTDNLTCYNQSTADADSDTVINYYTWYRNGTLYETGLNFTELTVDTTSMVLLMHLNNDSSVGENALRFSSCSETM